jgi:hypothetical protein
MIKVLISSTLLGILVSLQWPAARGFVTMRTSSKMIRQPHFSSIRPHGKSQRFVSTGSFDLDGQTTTTNKGSVYPVNGTMALEMTTLSTATTTSTIRSSEAMEVTPIIVSADASIANSATTITGGGLELWKRRLITHEDPFSLHKLASLSYTFSSFLLVGTAAFRYIVLSPEAFAIVPSSLEPLFWTFVVSNLVMCLASVRMSFLHRQGDVTARNAFLGTAVSSLFSGFMMVWISPLESLPVATWFNDDMINRGCFAVLIALNGVFILDTILKTDEVVEGRRDRKAHDYDMRKFIDIMGYVFPVAFGLPLIAATGYIASIWHDRPWFLEQCLFVDSQMGVEPGSMQAHIFYSQVITSMAASFASLFVTLRDKKLINKAQELTGISVFAIPALIYSAYTTFYFGSYLLVSH